MASSSSVQAAMAAKKGASFLLAMTSRAVSSVTEGITSARKMYTEYHEQDVLTTLKSQGVTASDMIFTAFKQLHYLNLAGYKNEAAAVTDQVVKRLIDTNKSGIPLESLKILGHALEEEATKQGASTKEKFSKKLKEFVKHFRPTKENHERDKLAHGFYYGFELLFDVGTAAAAAPGGEARAVAMAEKTLRECALRLLIFFAGSSSPSGPVPVANPAPVGNPYVIAGEKPTSPAMPKEVDDEVSRRTKVEKTLYLLGSSLRKEAEAEEAKRIKALQDAEAERIRALKQAEALLRASEAAVAAGAAAVAAGAAAGAGRGAGAIPGAAAPPASSPYIPGNTSGNMSGKMAGNMSGSW